MDFAHHHGPSQAKPRNTVSARPIAVRVALSVWPMRSLRPVASRSIIAQDGSRNPVAGVAGTRIRSAGASCAVLVRNTTVTVARPALRSAMMR